MQLTAVTKARALALIELDELNLGGKIRLSDCIEPIVEKYDFSVFPQKPEDFDTGEKGVKFESGKAGELLIDALVIYNGAIYLETLSSTNDSKRILLEMLEWGRDNLGLTYSEEKIRRWGYISDLVFHSDVPLLAAVSPAVQKLAEKTSSVTQKLWGLNYETLSISIGHDPTIRKNSIASLVIQHRINTGFSENKYYSEAPLPTDLHIKFLEEYESDIKASLK